MSIQYDDALLDALLVSCRVGTDGPPIKFPESNSENATSVAGSEVFGRSIYSAEERQLRRKNSNRESARRSRIRKQRLLQELRLDADRLQAENRVLTRRIGAVRRCRILFVLENERLQMESHALRRRLSEVRRAVLCRWLSMLSAGSVCGEGYAAANDIALASLIA